MFPLAPRPSDADLHSPSNCSLEDFLLADDHGRRRLAPSEDLLICGVTGRRYSTLNLVHRADYISRALARALGWHPHRGTQWDKVVCVYSANSVDTLPLAWAVQRLSGILTPASASSSVKELTHQLQSSGATAIFTSPQLLNNARAACDRLGIADRNIFIIETAVALGAAIDARCKTVDQLYQYGQSLPPLERRQWKDGQGARQVAFLCYSSGTSGLPKAVMITHSGVIAGILQYTRHTAVRKESGREVCLCVLPQTHIYGLVTICHAPLYRGAAVVVLPQFELLTTLAAVERYAISSLFLVPTIVLALLDNLDTVAKYNLSSVVDVATGAAPLAQDSLTTLHMHYPRWKILQGYGLTEAGPTVAMTPEDDIWPGSSGVILPGVQCRLIAPDGTDISTYGHQGELLVKSPALALGYLNNEIATRETFRDGWLHTGDVALFQRSAKGNDHVFVVDRLKELIKVKGLQVAPAELEAHILSLGEVAECAVFAVDDVAAGELPRAAVVKSQSAASLSNGDVARIVAKHVESHKSRHKWLKGGVDVLEALPRTSSGKILRRVLAEQERLRRKTATAAKL